MLWQALRGAAVMANVRADNSASSIQSARTKLTWCETVPASDEVRDVTDEMLANANNRVIVLWLLTYFIYFKQAFAPQD